MLEILKEIAIGSIAGALLWAAIDVKRKSDSKVKMYSKWWWLQFILIVSALLLFKLATNGS